VPDPHPVAAVRPEIERRVLASGGWVIRPGMAYGSAGSPIVGLLTAKAAERGTGVYIGEPGTRWPVVHVDDLADLYAAVVSAAPPGTIWHGVSENARLDAIAEALGGGPASSWPLEEAAAELGPLASLFIRDQVVSSAKTRGKLGWTPVHGSIVAYLKGQPGSGPRPRSAEV
jgi:nucleoside-diphosphate-sugar epimerase